ncbi:hypothetical protein JOC86_003049 [Bacillus pakistanensis]|uniref:Intracellular proteinase inhibitor BsuPI domain-containing protein n=1 Tax=Rossellomorea pakistanensis TaxID=992288 RepID=A0ABS2NF87_9BACI|nr:BsuPI-related putative proteinase inhibitor [Bacillus pakistanensis]MBM7586497.1 hypothetical protein [Bacillus pakistanensis]
MKKIVLLIAIFFLLLPSQTNANMKEDTNMLWEVRVTPTAESVTFEFGLYNPSDKGKTVQFQSSQIYDYVIKDAKGNKIFQFSDGKAFLQAIQHVRIEGKETKKWKSTWDLKVNGNRIEKGIYTIEAKLMAHSVNDKPIKFNNIAKESFTVEEENLTFRNIEVNKDKGKVIIDGEAKVKRGSFYYAVEDGHDYLVGETLLKVKKESPNWTRFSFSFPLIPKSDSSQILSLYERDERDGKIINTYSVDLE